jgi:hypothetical protein
VPDGKKVVHATSRGVREDDWGNGAAFCFRAKNLSEKESRKIEWVAQEITNAAEYGIARAVFKSWSGSSSFGSGALKRLEKYRTRMTNNQGTLTNVYCSELVVVAFQLGLDINTSHPSWIALDGKHTLPKTLKTWLERAPTQWQCVGKITGPSLTLTAI